MPNNKKKTVASIGGIDKAHPYSRRAAQLKRAVLREDKVARKRSERDNSKRRIVERMLWFKFAIPDDKPALADSDIHDTIDLYINRNQDDIARLVSQLRPGRPRSQKLELLESLRDKDAKEYALGTLDIPLLTDPKNVLALRSWEGDHNAITDIKVVRVRKPSTSSIAPATATQDTQEFSNPSAPDIMQTD